MKRKKRKSIWCILLSFMLSFILTVHGNMSATVSYAEEECPEELQLYASAAVLMDAENGRILYEKNGQEKKANASTTKIMTCILALELGEPEAVITFSSYAAAQPDVQMNACEGEQYYLKDLLYALMLESYNDVAVAIAEYIGGSVEGFADIMNEKAEELGAYDTHFVTPNGLDAEGHYTTACDLAKIARYAIQNPDFLEIVQKPAHTFTELNGKRNVAVTNRDAFLTSYDGAIGIKTGFTGNAGYCFVGAVKRDGKTLISVVLASGWPPHKTYKWTDTRLLMDYGMNWYSEQIILDSDFTLPEVKIENGIEADYVPIEMEPGVQMSLLMREDEVVRYEIHLPEVFEAPVSKGDIAGNLEIYIDDILYRSEVLYIGEDIHEINYRYIFLQVIKSYFLIEKNGHNASMNGNYH